MKRLLLTLVAVASLASVGQACGLSHLRPAPGPRPAAAQVLSVRPAPGPRPAAAEVQGEGAAVSEQGTERKAVAALRTGTF